MIGLTGVVAQTLLAATWPFPELAPLEGKTIALVWGYCLAWFVLQDIVKCVLYVAIKKLEPTIKSFTDKPQVTPTIYMSHGPRGECGMPFDTAAV